MRMILSVLGLFSALWAYGDVMPTYLKPLKGVVFNDLIKTSPFAFEPGTLQKCDRKEVVDMVIFDCALDKATATVKEGADSRTFEFTAVKIWFKYLKSYGYFNEYHYQGSWRDANATPALSSPVNLVLWYQKAAPDKVRGNLGLTEFGVTRAIQATP